jgi:homopolymeric O-antigen transport system permease protein
MPLVHAPTGQLGSDIKEMLAEQVQFRELLLQMTKRDLVLRYKQSVMGFGWAVFLPVLNTVLFSVIFTRVAPLATPVPYPIYAYAGLAPWYFFSNSLRFATTSLSGNVGLVTKVYFPREIFPLSALLVCAVDFAVSLTLLVALMVYYHIGVGPAVLIAPVIIAVQAVFTLAVGLMVSMANLFYRDVKYLVEAVLMIWMFATSVVYPTQLVGGRLGAVLALNPMTPLIEGFRSVLLLHRLPPAGPILVVASASLVLLGVSWLVFHRAEFTFAENV